MVILEIDPPYLVTLRLTTGPIFGGARQILHATS
jgi:hypothetical protein